jgi:hypothetical protein
MYSLITRGKNVEHSFRCLILASTKILGSIFYKFYMFLKLNPHNVSPRCYHTSCFAYITSNHTLQFFFLKLLLMAIVCEVLKFNLGLRVPPH